MYRTIVASKVRSTFVGLSAGNPDALLDQLAPVFEYDFRGAHALGGSRTSLDAMRRWFDRVYDLFPAIRFDVEEVVVKGPPWRTVVITHVHVRADGYVNEMFQKLDLRWGKLHRIETLENLEVLAAFLDAAALSGDTEAHRRPITD